MTEVVDGSPKQLAVVVGVVGDTATQIVSGATPGTVVSLADLGAAVPTSSTSSTSRSLLGGSSSGSSGQVGGSGAPDGGGAERLIPVTQRRLARYAR